MTKEDLSRLGLIELAVCCQKVADECAAQLPEIAEKALALKAEWVRLVRKETPPPPSYLENQSIQNDKAALRTRIIDFLADL